MSKADLLFRFRLRVIALGGGAGECQPSPCWAAGIVTSAASPVD